MSTIIKRELMVLMLPKKFLSEKNIANMKSWRTRRNEGSFPLKLWTNSARKQRKQEEFCHTKLGEQTSFFKM